MKKTIAILIILGLIPASVAFAGYGKKKAEAPATPPAEAVAPAAEAPAAVPAVEAPTVVDAATPVEVGNKICPISGKQVGEMGEIVKVEHNGKVYNLCCPGCLKDFQADPESYIKKLEELQAADAVDAAALPDQAIPAGQ
ncbi:MAG: hypothetical protein A2Z88_05750 [Omnitrophica WOR_2 bacterium GWA2_47_8]|nr:MAG: hypothetical protein A2Z88_05750 [Omnitrophica WOR_2 bacterium GWA2_47_8]